jgi:hypothetical protein
MIISRNAFDIGDPFVRELWSSVVPGVLVVFFCFSLVSVPVPERLRPVIQSISSPFQKAITLQEAEAFVEPGASKAAGLEDGVGSNEVPSLWRTLLLEWLALLETLVWLASGSYRIVTDESDIRTAIPPILISITWFYATLRPVLWPSPTAMFDLFSLYLAHAAFSILILGGLIFDNHFYGEPFPSQVILLAHACNLTILLTLITTILSMPLGVPSSKVNKDDIGKTVSPEDYCTLWQWISFHWVIPIIEKGTYNTLNEEDVWNLSPTNQSRPLFFIFSKRQHLRLLRRIWDANSFDLILDFALTFVSVVFNYAGPFFLQRILTSISEPEPKSRSKAYIYAFAAFLCTVLKVREQIIPSLHTS